MGSIPATAIACQGVKLTKTEVIIGEQKSKPRKNIRDPKEWYRAIKQHAGHSVEIKAQGDHTYLHCNDCQGYLIFKTWENGCKPVGFSIG